MFVVLLLFATFWIGQLARLIYDIPEIVDMCNFYTYLLQIPDVCARHGLGVSLCGLADSIVRLTTCRSFFHTI